MFVKLKRGLEPVFCSVLPTTWATAAVAFFLLPPREEEEKCWKKIHSHPPPNDSKAFFLPKSREWPWGKFLLGESAQVLQQQQQEGPSKGATCTACRKGWGNGNWITSSPAATLGRMGHSPALFCSWQVHLLSNLGHVPLCHCPFTKTEPLQTSGFLKSTFCHPFCHLMSTGQELKQLQHSRDVHSQCLVQF